MNVDVDFFTLGCDCSSSNRAEPLRKSRQLSTWLRAPVSVPLVFPTDSFHFGAELFTSNNCAFYATKQLLVEGEKTEEEFDLNSV